LASGGYAGASLRHLVGRVLASPLDTFAVNVVGAGVLALLLYRTVYGSRVGRRTRLLIGTGLLSSFTTYSTFVFDVVRAPPTRAAGLVIATYVGGALVVVAAGWLVRRRLTPSAGGTA
jgi:CrcB protein